MYLYLRSTPNRVIIMIIKILKKTSRLTILPRFKFTLSSITVYALLQEIAEREERLEEIENKYRSLMISMPSDLKNLEIQKQALKLREVKSLLFS